MRNEIEVRGDVTAIKLRGRDGEPIETLIDTADLEHVQSLGGTWTLSGRTDRPYVAARTPGTGESVYLHRWIMRPAAEMVVDHIDGDSLNNRRENLRELTQRENTQNNRRNTSGASGVYVLPDGICEARFVAGGTPYYVGKFDNFAEAASDLRMTRAAFGIRTVA